METKSRSRLKYNGFTLIESALVLLVISLFVLVPTVMTSRLSSTLEVQGFLDRLEKNLATCQQTAIISNRRTSMLQDSRDNRNLAFQLAPGKWLETLQVPEELTVSKVPEIVFAGGTGNAQSYLQFHFIWEKKNQKITYRTLFGKGNIEKIVLPLT
jgi:competence protein ComGD